MPPFKIDGSEAAAGTHSDELCLGGHAITLKAWIPDPILVLRRLRVQDPGDRRYRQVLALPLRRRWPADDDLSRRIRKTSNSVTTWYLYNGPDIVAEHEGGWQLPTAFTTHGPNNDDPIVRYTRHAAGGYDKRYYHQDAQNSAAAVTDGNGALVGAPLGRIGRYGYTGREPDAGGLIYYRARYYDPTLARFTQRDPSGLVRARPFSTSNETACGGIDCHSANGYDGGETLSDAEVAGGEVEFEEGAVRLAFGLFGCVTGQAASQAMLGSTATAWTPNPGFRLIRRAGGRMDRMGSFRQSGRRWNKR